MGCINIHGETAYPGAPGDCLDYPLDLSCCLQAPHLMMSPRLCLLSPVSCVSLPLMLWAPVWWHLALYLPLIIYLLTFACCMLKKVTHSNRKVQSASMSRALSHTECETSRLPLCFAEEFIWGGRENTNAPSKQCDPWEDHPQKEPHHSAQHIVEV